MTDPLRPPRALVRKDAGLWACEGALRRRGFPLIAGADEAGRGACAGPLVVAACVLPDGKRGQVPDLNDSKLLTAAVREEVYGEVVRRAVAWSVVVIPAADVDRHGLHVMNIEGMRRAVARLDPAPAYALTDGFPVRGLTVPALAVPGFFGGALFSTVLGIAGRRRRFDELSLPRFAAWGAVGGLLLDLVPAALVAVGLASLRPDLGLWQLTAIISGPLILLGAASASGSLMVARRAEDRELLEASDDRTS
jgi:hypothetical protein